MGTTAVITWWCLLLLRPSPFKPRCSTRPLILSPWPGTFLILARSQFSYSTPLLPCSARFRLHGTTPRAANAPCSCTLTCVELVGCFSTLDSLHSATPGSSTAPRSSCRCPSRDSSFEDGRRRRAAAV